MERLLHGGRLIDMSSPLFSGGRVSWTPPRPPGAPGAPQEAAGGGAAPRPAERAAEGQPDGQRARKATATADRDRVPSPPVARSRHHRVRIASRGGGGRLGGVTGYAEGTTCTGVNERKKDDREGNLRTLDGRSRHALALLKLRSSISVALRHHQPGCTDLCGWSGGRSSRRPRSFMSPMITSRVMCSHHTMPLFFYEKMRSRQTDGWLQHIPSQGTQFRNFKTTS